MSQCQEPYSMPIFGHNGAARVLPKCKLLLQNYQNFNTGAYMEMCCFLLHASGIAAHHLPMSDYKTKAHQSMTAESWVRMLMARCASSI